MSEAGLWWLFWRGLAWDDSLNPGYGSTEPMGTLSAQYRGQSQVKLDRTGPGTSGCALIYLAPHSHLLIPSASQKSLPRKAQAGRGVL